MEPNGYSVYHITATINNHKLFFLPIIRPLNNLPKPEQLLFNMQCFNSIHPTLVFQHYHHIYIKLNNKQTWSSVSDTHSCLHSAAAEFRGVCTQSVWACRSGRSAADSLSSPPQTHSCTVMTLRQHRQVLVYMCEWGHLCQVKWVNYESLLQRGATEIYSFTFKVTLRIRLVLV